MKEDENIVRFKDLSFPLKLAIVIAYLLGFFYFIVFLVGFILGIIETI